MRCSATTREPSVPTSSINRGHRRECAWLQKYTKASGCRGVPKDNRDAPEVFILPSKGGFAAQALLGTTSLIPGPLPVSQTTN